MPSLGRWGALLALGLVLGLAGCSSDKSPVLPVSERNLAVGRDPRGLATGLVPDTLLVSCQADDTIYEVNLARLTTIEILKVRKGPDALVSDPAHDSVYCLHLRENAISILSGEPLNLVRSLGTGDISLASGALRPGAGELWICDGVSSVYGLLVPSLHLKSRVHLGRYPQHLAFSRDGENLFVTLKGENALVQVSLKTGEEVQRVPVGIYPHDVLLIGNTACVSNNGSHDVSLIDLQTMRETARLRVRRQPAGLSALGHTLWVACEDSYRLVAINVSQARVIGSIKLNFYPGAVKALGDGTLVVTDPRGNRVAFLTPQSIPENK